MPRLCPLPFHHWGHLRVTRERRDVVLADADVVQEDAAVPRARCKDVRRPGQRADARCMAAHGSDLLANLVVPQLHVAARSADGEDASALAHPRDRCRVIPVGGRSKQLRCRARASTPGVDGGPERDGESVQGLRGRGGGEAGGATIREHR